MPYKNLWYENKKNFINHIDDDDGRDELFLLSKGC